MSYVEHVSTKNVNKFAYSMIVNNFKKNVYL